LRTAVSKPCEELRRGQLRRRGFGAPLGRACAT
jgi:hypothetical protein